MPKQKSTTTKRLIKTTVEALPIPASGQAVYWDADLTGFGVRISDRGTRTYFVQSRMPDGRQVKIKIGRHGAVTAEQARARAKAMLGAMAAGDRPGGRAPGGSQGRDRTPSRADHGGPVRPLPQGACRAPEAARSSRGDRTLIDGTCPAGDRAPQGRRDHLRRRRGAAPADQRGGADRGQPHRGAAQQGLQPGDPLGLPDGQPLQGHRA